MSQVSVRNKYSGISVIFRSEIYRFIFQSVLSLAKACFYYEKYLRNEEKTQRKQR